MKTKSLIITTAIVAAVGLGALSIGSSFAHGPFGKGGPQGAPGYGMMHQGGPGAGPGAGMHQGYGMMQPGQGFGPGQMGGKNFGDCPRGQGQALQTPLTVDDVRANFEQHLQGRGNDRLKVGAVTEQDADTITVEIVTVDDSLVRKIQIDKATGRHMPVQ